MHVNTHVKTFAQYTATVLTGDSGEEYDFDVHGLDTPLEDGGVYAITRRTEDGEHIVLYIGETGNVSDRQKNHHKSECFDDNGADCLCIHLDRNKTSRLKKEADLMSRYRPVCNGPKW